MSDVQHFQFHGLSVRTILREKEPWFVTKDVCLVLGIGNYRDATSGLDEDEKGVGTIDTLGGMQSMSIISESGLYALIFKSRKPEAKAFRKWVTSEVLPALRKTGSYALSGLPSGLHLRLAPRVRAQVLASVVQMAKMSGRTDPEDVDDLFDRYCSLVGEVSPLEAAAGGETDGDNELLALWESQCLRTSRGGWEQMRDLYASLQRWWPQDRPCPSIKRLGRWLMRRYHRKESNVIRYFGLRLRQVGIA